MFLSYYCGTRLARCISQEDGIICIYLFCLPSLGVSSICRSANMVDNPPIKQEDSKNEMLPLFSLIPETNE